MYSASEKIRDKKSTNITVIVSRESFDKVSEYLHKVLPRWHENLYNSKGSKLLRMSQGSITTSEKVSKIFFIKKLYIILDTQHVENRKKILPK